MPRIVALVTSEDERVSRHEQLKAGYAERIITPPLGVDLAGYGFYLRRRANSVLDDLRVKALHLSRGARQIAIISCDLIGFSLDFADSVRRETASALGMRIQDVLLACTHTHSGPATKSTLGLGEMNPAYMEQLAHSIVDTARRAADGAGAARFRRHRSIVEPLGFNRRTRGFAPIDPVLKVAVFGQRSSRILLVNYACHPVMLGPSRQISGDWPGALARELEKKGDHCLFLQGCCGDIDPVTNLNQWGSGTPADIAHHGARLAYWVLRTADRAPSAAELGLYSAEKRISIPLDVWPPGRIRREAENFARRFHRFPGAARFSAEWAELALHRRTECRSIENVPVQVLGIGDLRLVALPGEPFCEIGLKVESQWPGTWTLGYANGTTGYIPTRKAYARPDDYACYCAPRFQTVFPFTRDIGTIMKGAATKLLKKLSR